MNCSYFFIIILFFYASVHSALIIESIHRVIDLSTPNVAVKYDINLNNDETKPVASMQFPILTSLLPKIYHLKALEDEDKEIIMCKSNVTERLQYSVFNLKFNKELVKGESKKIQIEIIQFGVLIPYPETMQQTATQTLSYSDSCSSVSAYSVTRETTRIIVGDAVISLFSKCNGSQTNNKFINIGPVKNLIPFSYDVFHLIIETNRALPKFSSHTRVYYISQWGFINVLESMVIQNLATQIKGEYSRFVEEKVTESSGLNSLSIQIPSSAYKIEYFDDLGNISTSSVTLSRAYTELILETRFPIYGGWFTNFYIKYLLTPLKIIYTNKSNSKTKLFKLPIISLNVNDFPTDISTTVVYLPEFATNARAQIVSARCMPVIKQLHSVYYLDVLGRLGFSIQLDNTCTETSGYLEILYDYDDMNIIWKPIRVALFFFLIFTLIHISLTIKLPILYKHHISSELRYDGLISNLKNKADSFYDQSRKYFLQAINLCGVTDLSLHNKTSASYESDARLSHKLLLETLNDDSLGSHSIKTNLMVIQQFVQTVLDDINEFSQSRTKFISKEIPQEVYTNKGLEILNKIEETRQKLNRIFRQYAY